LDIIGGNRRDGRDRKANRSTNNRRNQTREHGIPPPVTAHGVGLSSIKTKPVGRNGAEAPNRACLPAPEESPSAKPHPPTDSITNPGRMSAKEPKLTSAREKSMQRKLMLSITAGAAAILFQPTIQTVWAQGQAALTGVVSSEAEGNMEGVVVTAQKAGSIVRVSVTTDAQGRYAFPDNRLEPG